MGPGCQALPCLRRCSWWVPAVRGANRFFLSDALPFVRRCSQWVTAVRGRIVFFRTHFLACEDVAGGSQQSGGNLFFAKYGGPSGGSQQSGGKRFFREIRWPVRWVPAVRWRNHYFARNKESLPCCGRGPSCQPLHVQSTSDGSHSFTTLTTSRAPRRWTTARPRKGTTRSRGRRGSGSPLGEEYEGSLVRLRCEAAVAAE